MVAPAVASKDEGAYGSGYMSGCSFSGAVQRVREWRDVLDQLPVLLTLHDRKGDGNSQPERDRSVTAKVFTSPPSHAGHVGTTAMAKTLSRLLKK